MRFDQYKNPIFNEDDLFKALYKGHRLTFDKTIIVDRTDNIQHLESYLDFSFVPPINDNELDIADYDRYMQLDWHMPEDYKNLDIESFILEQAPPWDPNFTRTKEELEEFKARNMLDLLRWLKYFVDTCLKENIIWGVGRGSSVASYVLYLLGVHRIDSVKYNLDWREFLR